MGSWLGQTVIPVFDSNILIDILLGHKQALAELHNYEKIIISVVSWVEVMSGSHNAEEEKQMEMFLSSFEIAEMDIAIARIASRLRKQFHLKLPDTIIWATAQHRNTLLVTRNSKDFPASLPEIRIPYKL